MRKLSTAVFATALLTLLLLPHVVHASIPIEEAQREFQGRYHFITGGYVPWPACPCGTPAPAFPTNNFYGDLDRNPSLAVQLVQNLADNFYWRYPVYPSFLASSNGSDGVAGRTSYPTNYADGDFPVSGGNFALGPGAVTLDNYTNGFPILRGYIEKLIYVGQSGSLTNLAIQAASGTSTNDCAEARKQASDLWNADSWEPVDLGPISANTLSWVQLPYLTNYHATMSNRRGSVYSPVGAGYPGFRTGGLTVYLNLAAQDGGSDGTSPPVTADRAYHLFETREVAAGDDYTSAMLAGSRSTIMGECTVAAPRDNPPGDQQGWWLTDAFLVLKPDFNIAPDRIACGGDGCASCGLAGDIPGKVGAGLSSLDVRISLGPDSYGKSAGYFYLHADQPSAALYSPASLLYSTPTGTTPAGVGPATDNDGVFLTPNLTVQLQSTSAGYALYFTNRNVYPPELLSSVTIESNSSPSHMVITEVLGSNGAPRVIQFNYTTNTAPNSWTWEMDEGNGLRVESRTTTWISPTDRTDTTVVRSGTGPAVAQTVENYHLYDWGLTLVQRVVGAGASALTNTWTYYTDPQAAGYGQPQQMVEPGGRWEQYTYDTAGRLTKKVAQFGNSAPGSADSANRVTQVSYNGIVILTVESLLGSEVARSYEVHLSDVSTASEQVQTIRCVTPGAGVGATGNLTNILWRATADQGDTHAWDTLAELQPDGTMTSYGYYGYQTIVQTGDTGMSWADKVNWTPANGYLSIVDGTQTTTTVGTWGETSSVLVEDLASSPRLTLAWDYYQYDLLDPLRRSHTVTHLDTTTEAFTYSCCGLGTYTDRDGARTEYFYDAARRQTASLRLGILTTNVMDAAGNVLKTIRIGTDNSQITLRQAAYDLAGRVASETNAMSGATSYSVAFGANGRTVSTVYPDTGTRIELYNQDGSLQSVTGTAVFPAYYTNGVDGAGAYTKETKDNPSGSEWTKTYADMLGRDYKTVYASATGAPYSVAYYNAQGQLTNQVDPDGISVLYAYNAKGEQTCSVLDSNQNHTINWDGPDRITLTTNDVVQWQDVWDNAVIRRTRTYQWSETGPVLASETWAAADGLRRASFVFGLTNEVRTLYAGSGYRYVTNTASDGTSTTQTYQNGRLLSSATVNSQLITSDRTLNSTTYGYDEHGRPKTVADGRNGITTRTYKSNSDLLESVTTPQPGTGQAAQTTTFYYNKMLQVTNTVQPDNTSVFAEYYPTGLRKWTHGSRAYPVSYTYDPQGRLQTMTTWRNASATNTAAVTTWNYDSYRGWLAGKSYNNTQAAGPTYSNTPAGRLAARTWARGIQASYGYNDAGDLASVSYSSGAPNLSYGYDRRGRPTAVAQTGTPISSLAYNDAGQLLTESWLSGPLSGLGVQNHYDGYLRRTNVSVFNQQSTLDTINYSHDAASRLFSVSDGTNSATYSYVPMSPLVSQVAFARNGTSRLTTTKQWDLLNRLQSVSSAAASFSYGYNNANQRTNATLADNSRWVYTYDSLGQVTSGKKYWSDGSLVAGQQFDYAFDDIGNRNTTSIGGDSAGQNLHTANYTNNALNQISSRSVPGFAQVIGAAATNATVTLWADNGSYATTSRKGEYFRGDVAVTNSTGAVWLAVTNLAVLRNGTNADYAVTNVGHLFLPQTPEAFGHDADGNMTNDGRWVVSWDAANRATAFASLTGAPTGSKRKVECAYDYAWRRAQKIVSTNNGTAYGAQYTNRFVYDGWKLIAMLDGNNSLLQSYAWGADLSGGFHGAGGVGGLVSVTVHQGASAGTYFYCYDGSGNVTALVNAADGTVAAQYEYGPFGELLRATGPLARMNPFLFSTKFCDLETGFYYYGFRYYDPGSGGWLSRDPAGEMAGANLSAFVDNDPQNAVDPDGEDKYRPYDYQNRIPNSLTYDLNTGQQQASDGFPLTPNITAMVFVGACGEVVGGVGLLIIPEPTLTKVGGSALALDGADKLQAMFRSDRTVFEKGMIAISGDPNYDPSTSVLLKDLSLTALTAAAAKVPNAPRQCCCTKTVYRVEGLPNTRIIIGEQGQVSVEGDQMLFLNVGDKARAQEFLAARLQQKMPGAQTKSFEIPQSFLRELQESAVPESMAKQCPSSPLLVDPTKAPNQFGLRADQIEALKRAIIQGTGKVQ